MKLKRILALVLCFAMVLSTISFNVFAEETAYVAKVGDVECADASAMISALNSASGDVNVEIYGKIVTSGFGLNNSNITKLSFVAVSDDAEICVDGISYIDVRNTNYPIEYTGLILSHINAGQNIDGFLPQYFSTYNGGNVTYKECTFPNGVTACGSVAGTTYEFTDCIFNNTTSGLYSLWVYGNSTNVVVNGGEFCGVRGIKMYSEGSGDFSSLSVSNATFSDTITEKHAVVLTKGESVTLTGNIFKNTKGTVQVDDDYASLIDGKIVTIDGTEYTVDSENLTLEESTPAGITVATVDGTPYTDLQDALDAAVAGEGNVTVEILEDIALTNVDWTPVTVSAPKYPVVTVNGNGKTITGLNDMLFAGTWAGGSGLIINDLTIADSAIVNDKDDAKGTVGVGAFIGFPQASATVTLNNCHLVDSRVEGGHWTGGLIGYAAGYAGNDGPVFMNLTIKDCSVTGSTIIGKGSAGGVIGHATGNAWTQVTIADTTVSGNTVTSTGSSANKAGAVIGTIGAAGQATTVNGVEKIGGVSVAATVSDNDVTSDNTKITTIYGRQGTGTGMLYVTGGEYDNYPIEENVAYAAPVKGYEIADNGDGTWGLAEKIILSGKGTKEEPYVINGIDDLKRFRDDVNEGNTYEGKYVKLTCDINLSNEVWTPIGSSIYDKAPSDADVKMFAGNFDGGNHTITGLTSDGYAPASSETKSTEYSFGLFGYVYGANISNVKLADVDIDCGTRTDSDGNEVYGSGVAALIGYYVPADGKTVVIENCHVLSGTVKASNNMGGLIGYMHSQLLMPEVNITVKDCSNAADVTTEAREAGGILGYLGGSRTDIEHLSIRGTITFKNCVNTGDITSLGTTGNSSAGGIVGCDRNEDSWQHAMLIYDTCTNLGTITVNASGETHVGGIGACFYSIQGTRTLVKNCANTGAVVVKNPTGDVYAGGLVSHGGIVEIDDSTNTGTVTVGEEEGNKYIGAANILFLNGMHDFKDTIGGTTYFLNGGVAPALSDMHDGSGNYNFHPVKSASKEGFEFDGWYDNAGNLYDENANIRNVGNLTLYAEWNGYVAKIGENYYSSLESAFKDAKDGDIITLVDDVTEDVTIGKNITIDGAGKNYTGTMTANAGISATVQNVNFINGGFDKATKSTTGTYTIKNCTFDGQGTFAYPVRIRGANTVVIEECTVKNYLYSFLYVPSGTNTVSVKDVTVEDCPNYAVYFASGVNSATIENLTVKNSNNGFIINNTANRAFTIKDCKMENVVTAINHSSGTETITCTVLGTNNFGTSASSEYAKYVLSDVDATLKAGEGYTVTAANEMHKVVYEGGIYKINKVAKIGENYYSSLELAFSDAKDGDTITLVADIELSTTIRNTKEITLDLNGKTITGKDETSKNFSLIDNGGKLTVTGNGKMTLTATIDSDWNRYSAVIANNPGGKLVIENGTFEHLGGTDMAYGIDNLTNGKGTYAETIINGGTIKSVYRGIRQFLNGVEAQNILTVNGGSVEGANKGIWVQSANKNANTGKITIEENASVTGGVFLTASEGATDWPVEAKIAKSAIDQLIKNDHIPDAYVISLNNGYYGVVKTDIKGEGSEDAPYLINNLVELEWFRNSVNKGTDYSGKFVKLAADIDLENNAWTPIGTSSSPFKGTFDGADKTISNLNVEGENNQGFFGYATEAKISNLILDNVSVKGTDCVGAVVGQGYALTYIDNCKVTGTIKIEGLTNVGGITGKYYARVTNSLVDGENVSGSYIKGTYKEADLEGDNVGGIMGHAGENNAHSNNTVKNITIEGTRKVGGLIGTTDRATDISGCVVENVIIKCSATEEYAADNASTTTLGGLIGNYYGTDIGGTIYSSTVKDVVFEKGNATNVGAIVGGVRVAPEATEVEGVTVDDNIVVEAVTGTTNGLMVPAGTYQASADGIRYDTIADAMSKAITGSTVVIFEGDYEGGLNVNKSITVVGEGEVNFKGKLNVTANGATVKGLNFNNGGGSAGYINAKDVLIEDCEVVGGNGFRSCYTGGTVTFKDSIITGSVYGIHFDGSKDGNIVIDNCEITGWTSFARTITKVTIKDTEFKTGNYNQLRFYQDAEITGTQFNPDMNVDFGTNDVECVIESCTVTDGSPVTDVIYIGDIAEMGVDVIIDNEPVKVPAYLTKDGEKEYYLSINDAIKAANGAGTVTLTEDTAENITVNAPVDEIALLSSTESLVLDLNGKTLTGYIYVDYDATIEIKNGTVINYTTGKDTIASFGNITLTDINADGVRHIVRAKNGNVVINSGTYKYTGSENGTRHAVNIGDDEIDTNVATAVIYGGTFIGPKGTAADSGSAVLVQERSKVLVYGGEFSGGKLLTLSAQPDAVLDLRGGTYDQNPSQYVIEPAFAAYKNADGTYSVVADRSLELTASTDKLYEGEEVTIEVVVNGENIAGTSWTLNWNKNYFKPHADENLENTGSVNDSAWTEGHEVVFDDKTVVKKYTFVAIAQDVEVTGQFTIGNPCATTHIESFDGTEVKAGLVNETANVTILLRDYEYEKFFDNEDVTAVDTASADFDGDPHTFKIVPKDSELINSITYKVNDVEVKEVSLTEEGTYTITYKIDGKTGYADYEGTFTVVIDEADFVVEVNPYTDNTELVLVYTNTPKLRFKYDNAAMLNVKAARKDGKTYEYGNAEDDGYAYVYGYVVDVADTSMITYTGDNSEVFAIDSAYVLAQIDEKFDFLADINFSSTLNVQDIVTEYGVAYEHSALLANIKYQRNLLKADVDGNKVINNDDPTFVVGKVKTAMGLR